MIQSTPNNKAEKDHPDNVSLAGDGFDVVIKAKKAIDAIPSCRNKVSCADILALATRDVIVAVSYTTLFINLTETSEWSWPTGKGTPTGASTLVSLSFGHSWTP